MAKNKPSKLLKRALNWESGHHDFCLVCGKDFKYCPHNHFQNDDKVFEIKVKEILNNESKHSSRR